MCSIVDDSYNLLLFILIINLFKVDDIAKILHAQKIYINLSNTRSDMLINVNCLIKSEVNKKYVNILILSCTILYNGQTHPEYFAVYAAKFQNAPEHFTTLCMKGSNINYKVKITN